MNSLETYLTFNGNCEEAFNFYAEALNGEIIMLSRFSDMPPDPNFPVPEEGKNKVMHATLQFKPGLILMGSDNGGQPSDVGNNFSISINAESEEEVDQLFAALSDGGEVSMPPGKVFWGSYFGMCKDKFDINWMFSFEYKD